MGHSSIWQSVLPGESRASSWTQRPHRRVMGPRRLRPFFPLLHPFWWSNHLDPWETLLRCNKKQLQLRLAPGWVPLHSAFCLSMHLICLGSPTSQPKLERLREMWHIPRRPSGESPDLQRDGVKELKVPRHRTDHPHDLGGWSAPEWDRLTEIAVILSPDGSWSWSSWWWWSIFVMFVMFINFIMMIMMIMIVMVTIITIITIITAITAIFTLATDLWWKQHVTASVAVCGSNLSPYNAMFRPAASLGQWCGPAPTYGRSWPLATYPWRVFMDVG